MYHVTLYILFIGFVYRRSEETSTEKDTHPLPPQQQSSYLVFEAALLSLFTACVFCGSSTRNLKKVVVGSLLRVIQWCKECGKKRVWESQPYIGNIPAGNILTSAAILYSGALPSKVLKVFQILNCRTITRRSYFSHQTKFLQPSVHSIWKSHQQQLIESLLKENRELTLAGDGRADSPGHSAKYGSYTVVDLTCNKVVDFKLVQVSGASTKRLLYMQSCISLCIVEQ